MEVAELFGIGEATLRRWLRRARETGSVAPITDYSHGPSPKIEHANLLVLEELMRETPDATNAELAERMEARTGISVSAATIRRAVNILGWTRKSSSSPEKPKPRILGIFVRAGEPGNGR